MKIRKGQPSAQISKAQFIEDFSKQFFDPNFDRLRFEIQEIADQAWENYRGGRKSPKTIKAGKQFFDPSYDLSVEWNDTRIRLNQAQKKWEDSHSRILIINGSPRNEHTCPGEVSKSYRMVEMAKRVIENAKMECEILDLSRLTAEYGKKIYPCKACVSTAMPLCHWPCSCYPNNSLGQTGDWMADIYESWVKAHGVLIITPVHWYQSPAALKLMIDRLVCADGGNPDPTTTQGKKPALAKKIELKGWDFPKHLAGRAYGLVVHGDSIGAEEVRRGLADWLDDMELIPAQKHGTLDGYIGYYKPYATSHDEMDKDRDFVAEIKLTVGALVKQVKLIRSIGYRKFDLGEDHPRKK